MTNSFFGLLRSIISTFPIQNFLLLISKVGLVQKDKYSIPGFNVKMCTENSKPLESFHKIMISSNCITTPDTYIMSGDVGSRYALTCEYRCMFHWFVAVFGRPVTFLLSEHYTISYFCLWWKEVFKRWQIFVNFRIWTQNVSRETWLTFWWKPQLTSVWLFAKHWSLPTRHSPSPSPLERKLSSLTTGNWQPAPGSTRRRSPLVRFGGKRREGRLENQKSLKKWLSFQHVLPLKNQKQLKTMLFLSKNQPNWHSSVNNVTTHQPLKRDWSNTPEWSTEFQRLMELMMWMKWIHIQLVHQALVCAKNPGQVTLETYHLTVSSSIAKAALVGQGKAACSQAAESCASVVPDARFLEPVDVFDLAAILESLISCETLFNNSDL